MVSYSSQRFRVLFFGTAAIALISAQAQTASASRPRISVETITGSQSLRDGIEIQAGTASLRIIALRDDILRVRVAPGGALPEDASWAVLPGPRSKSVDVQPSGDAASVGFHTGSLDVRVERTPLRLVVRDLDGNIISADAVGRATTLFQPGGFSVYKNMPTDEHYFGLGDKTCSFDRRNQAYTLWNTDIGFQESVDPIYKSIPFFMGVNGGPLDYYLLYGPSPKQVVEGYAYLTGTPPLPPLWALGFQQSRYSYTPESKVREIADRLRKDKIPCDVL